MPIYEYVCSSCGHDMEVMQSLSEAPLRQCPKCKRRTLKKLVSAAGFQLKGTGWYVTDFRDRGKPKEENKEKAEAESTTETKADETKKGEKESKDTKKPEKTEKKKSDTKKKAAAD